MKKSHYEKKLSVKKMTVSNLNPREMSALAGGLAEQTCDPQISTCRHSCGYTYCANTTCCSTGQETADIERNIAW